MTKPEKSTEPQKRRYISFDSTLFPLGLTPGHIVQIKGDCGKTLLITNLIARFLTTYPTKRAIFIDTRHHFSLLTFVRQLQALNPQLDKNPNPSLWEGDPAYISFLERLIVIKCYTPEDLILCLGPRGRGHLEQILEVQSDIAIVFIDSLDNFTYCSSVGTFNETDFFDFGKTLKRSVESTNTPVICSMLNLYRAPTKTLEEDEVDVGFTLPRMTSNIVFDPTVFTHTVLLERATLPSRLENTDVTLMCRAYLRSSSKPNRPLSGVSHFVKFSISSGILLWCCD